MNDILAKVIEYWKELSVGVGAIAAFISLRLDHLRSQKIKKEIAQLRKQEKQSPIQIATFEQVEKYGNIQGKGLCPRCHGSGIDPASTEKATSCAICGGSGVIYSKERSGKAESGCFIATSVYGSEDCEQVRLLREYRDNRLLTRRVGRALVNFYYRLSPSVATWLSKHKGVSRTVRIVLDIFVAHITKKGTGR